MNDPNNSSRSNRVSSVNVSAQSVDMNDRQAFGKAFFALLYRAFRIGAIYRPEHELCQEAIDEFMGFFRRATTQRSAELIELAIRGNVAMVNGEALRLTPAAEARLAELRTLFSDADFRRVLFGQNLSRPQISRFLGHLHRVLNTEHVDDLDEANIPNVRIERGQPTRSIEEGLSEVARQTYTAHTFVRPLIKTRHVHRTYRKKGEVDFPVRDMRHLTRQFAHMLSEQEWRLLGLPNVQLLSARLATHSLNSAIYGIFLALKVGLGPRMAGELGAALLIDDFRRLKGRSVDARRPDPPRKTYEEQLDSLGEHLGAAPASEAHQLANIIAMEDEQPLDEPIGSPHYLINRDVHAAGRIADIARTYDAMVQGFDGEERRSPDRALRDLDRAKDAQLDSALVRLFANTMGHFPVGMHVRLSNGQPAIVVEPPAKPTEPARPVVRLLEDDQTLIDLSAPRYAAAQVAGALNDSDDGSAIDDAADVFLLQ